MSAVSRAGRTREEMIQSQIAKIIPNRRQKTSHKRGELHLNTIVSRLPNGMPIKQRNNSSFRLGHRLGSRLRNRTQRFLQKGRQLERRNPALAALRIAPVRNYENENPTNVLLAQRHGLVNAHNFVEEPLDGYWDAIGNPIAEGTRIQNGRYAERPRIRENHLSSSWIPVATEARRPMTNAERHKEEQFRQQLAEEAQRRARGLYRSPRNISRSPRKAKSLSMKKTKYKLKKRSL